MRPGNDVTAPRNRKAVERGQALRAEIRALLEAHPPLAPPLTAKHVQPRLSRSASLRTIRRHLQALRSGADTWPSWPSAGDSPHA
jgi:hypothetical protein